jgi:hypothetical protein
VLCSDGKSYDMKLDKKLNVISKREDHFLSPFGGGSSASELAFLVEVEHGADAQRGRISEGVGFLRRFFSHLSLT